MGIRQVFHKTLGFDRVCHGVTALQPWVGLPRWAVGLSYYGSR